MGTPFKPNDVAIILRPDYEEGREWSGNFEIIIAGVGPVSIPEDNMRDIVGMAMIMAASVPAMEEDVNITEKLMTKCAEVYGDADDVMLSGIDEEHSLTASTKCVGGIQ